MGIVLRKGEVTDVKEVPNLWALEIDPAHEQVDITTTLSMGSQMEQMPFMGNLTDFAEMNPPGLDEAMAFGKVLEYVDDSEFDIVVFDTAPTGHTLKLLSIPDMLSGWLGKILMMRLKFNQLFSAFKNMFSKDETNTESPLKALKKLKTSIESVKRPCKIQKKLNL